MRSFLLFFCVYTGVTYAKILKCCPENQVLLRKTAECWEPISNITTKNVLSCENNKKFSRFYIDENEKLVLRAAGHINLTLDERYCIGNQTNLLDVELKNVTQAAVFCYEEPKEPIENEISAYCMIVSVVFLILTAGVYVALPELRDLLGKSFISLCCTLGLGLMLITTLKLKVIRMSIANTCSFRGYLAYFFLISSFFWMNAISIQIFLSIRRPLSVKHSWKDFLKYAAYAWGCPAVLTGCMAAVNFAPGDHEKPGIGLHTCWFRNINAQWQYMYSVMTILIIANICIFVYTSINLWRTSFATSHTKALKYKFHMSLRLFVLMGVSWIFEVITSTVESHIIWTITDMLNSLQGFFIFLVLVPMRRKTVKAMHQHGWLKCVGGAVERHLAAGSDDEEDVIVHDEITTVPLGNTH